MSRTSCGAALSVVIYNCLASLIYISVCTMARRKSATIQLKVRMKESVRAQLATAAKRHGVSLNSEIASRIEQTFAEGSAHHQLINAVFGNERHWRFAKLWGGIITALNPEGAGTGWPAFQASLVALANIVKPILERDDPDSYLAGMEGFGVGLHDDAAYTETFAERYPEFVGALIKKPPAKE